MGDSSDSSNISNIPGNVPDNSTSTSTTTSTIITTTGTADDRAKDEFKKIKDELMQEQETLIDNMNTMLLKASKDIADVSNNSNIGKDDKDNLIMSLKNSMEQHKQIYQTKIDDIKTTIESKQKIMTAQLKDTQGTNWDDENNQTLQKWIQDCNKQHFIYDYVLSNVISRSQMLKVIILVITALQSLFSASNLGVSDSKYYIILTLKIVLLIMSTAAYICTQYYSLADYDSIIKNYTSYTENLNTFLTNLVMVAEMKSELRPDGDTFILNNRGTYTDLYSKNPYMKQSDWNAGMKAYQSYLMSLSADDKNTNNYVGRNRTVYNKYASGASGVGGAGGVYNAESNMSKNRVVKITTKSHQTNIIHPSITEISDVSMHNVNNVNDVNNVNNHPYYAMQPAHQRRSFLEKAHRFMCCNNSEDNHNQCSV